jgi:uncharacterized protein (DUF433 family)
MAKEIAPRIVVDPDVRFGKPVIRGTRVPVATVLGQLAAGVAHDEIMRGYSISEDDILAVLAYAADVLLVKKSVRVKWPCGRRGLTRGTC